MRGAKVAAVLMAALSATLITGCKATLADGIATCGDDGDCPSGFACRAESGDPTRYCFSGGTRAPTLVGPSGASGAGSSGGAAGTGAAGGRDGGGGTPDAGNADASSIDRACNDQVPCPSHASCVREPDHSFCKCADGYRAFNDDCVDIDECETDNGKCGDATYWACTNREGEPPICADIDECAAGTDAACGTGAAGCANTERGYKCICDHSYQLAADVHGCSPRWSAATAIESSDLDATGVRAVANGPNKALALWVQGDDLVANRYEGGTGWGTAAPIDAADGEPSSQLLAGNDAGAAMALWSQAGATWQSRFFPPSGWSPAVQVTAVRPGALAVDGAGRAVAIWSEPRASNASCKEVWVNRNSSGATWGTPENVDPDPSACESTSQDVGVTSSGDALVAWNHRDTLGRVLLSGADCYLNSTCNAPTGPIMGLADTIDVTMNAAGDALVTWVGSDGAGLLSSRHDLGHNWGGWIKHDEPAVPNRAMTTAIDPTGNATLIWPRHNDRYTALWATMVLKNGQSTDPVAISPLEGGDTAGMASGADGSGATIVVWAQSESTNSTAYRIWANRYVPDAGWGKPFRLSPSDGGPVEGVALAVDQEGSATAVWVQRDTMGTSIWASHFD